VRQVCRDLYVFVAFPVEWLFLNKYNEKRTVTTSDIHWTLSFIAILLFISVFVIAMGWMIYFKLFDSGEVGTVGSYTFMIPVLSTIFSMVILKESLTLTFVAGLVLIAASVYLVNTVSPGKRGNRGQWQADETKSCTNE
jgi:drug/metabolite transporter (DMT)-like permease